MEDVNDVQFEVQNAQARTHKSEKRVDEAMDAVISIRDARHPEQKAVKATSHADLAAPRFLGFIPRVWAFVGEVVIELERARIRFENFPGPWLMHNITIAEKDGSTGKLTGKKETKKCYQGGPVWGEQRTTEEWWTSYRYQLEGFVEMVRLHERNET